MMNCPQCATSLTPLRTGAVEFHSCRNCKGMWFEREKLHPLLRPISFQRIEASMAVKRARHEGRLPIRMCPRCNQRALDLHRYREVQVDVCPVCRGLWLDSGELNALVINYQRSRPPDPPSAGRESPVDMNGSSTDSTVLIFETADIVLDSTVLEGIADLIVNVFDLNP